MILIFGGTTEGRLAVETLDEAGAPYFYSTRGEAQAITCRHGQRITGALDGEAMAAFCSTGRRWRLFAGRRRSVFWSMRRILSPSGCGRQLPGWPAG